VDDAKTASRTGVNSEGGGVVSEYNDVNTLSITEVWTKSS
jgi:hypothetical protein